MPRVNIYIRNEDWPIWEGIKHKPDWIHQHLTEGVMYHGATVGFDGLGVTSENNVDYGQFCKHGAALGFCKHGCK